MDANDFKRKYKEELAQLNRIRKLRLDSVRKDTKHNPEFGTLTENSYPHATTFDYENEESPLQIFETGRKSHKVTTAQVSVQKHSSVQDNHKSNKKANKREKRSRTKNKHSHANDNYDKNDDKARKRKAHNISPQRTKRDKRSAASRRRIKQPQFS